MSVSTDVHVDLSGGNVDLDPFHVDVSVGNVDVKIVTF
jgi:hypothetical protein